LLCCSNCCDTEPITGVGAAMCGVYALGRHRLSVVKWGHLATGGCKGSAFGRWEAAAEAVTTVRKQGRGATTATARPPMCARRTRAVRAGRKWRVWRELLLLRRLLRLRDAQVTALVLKSHREGGGRA